MKSLRSLVCGHRELNLSTCQVMGVINLTPDSFSDGGTLFNQDEPDLDLVCRRVEEMISAGATIIDLGAESTRPGATLIEPGVEIDRVAAALTALVPRFDTVFSVDTSQAALIRESARLGAGLINDVRALGKEGAVSAVAETGVAVCLMHMQGEPATMQQQPDYQDVVDEVMQSLAERAAVCTANGIDASKIVVDPGFGFGKSVEHNLRLIAHLEELTTLNYPVLLGVSRKSTIGTVLDKPVDQRLAGGLALTCLAVEKGAKIIRTHDVAATLDVVRMTEAVLANRK